MIKSTNYLHLIQYMEAYYNIQSYKTEFQKDMIKIIFNDIDFIIIHYLNINKIYLFDYRDADNHKSFTITNIIRKYKIDKFLKCI